MTQMTGANAITQSLNQYGVKTIFGLGAQAANPDKLGAAIDRAFKEEVPALIEVPVGEMPPCRPHMPMIRDKDKAK